MPVGFHLTFRLGTLAAVLALASGPLAGQAPVEREQLEHFRDSLSHTVDSTGMVRLESQLIEQARGDRNNPTLHLRLGFVAIRLAELGSLGRYEDAAGEFEWATEIQSTWPYGWYGLGIAEDGVGDSQVSLVAGLQAMFGKDHLTRAANAYAKSVEVDPSFVRGLVELASTALRQRVNLRVDVAREALRKAASTSASANPEVLLYRGRVEREVGDVDSALAAFQSYLTGGGRRGLGLVEVARTLFLMGSLDGQGPYYEGAALDDSTTVRAYREDLALVANDSALAEFDGSRGERRVNFLHRFWGQRDRGDLRRDGERLREHYRRLYYVRRNFQLVSTNRHYDIVERYRSGSRDFDDRGIVYLRHGEPTDRATTSLPGIELNESWRYARADGDLLFHFVAREDVQDYKLVESVFDVLGFSATIGLRGSAENRGTSYGVANELLQSRERLSPIYSRLLSTGGAASQKYFTEERELGRRSIALGTKTDSYELRFSRGLRAQAVLAVVGDDSAGSLLHIAYAIPGSSLNAVPSSRGNVYPVRARLTVFDASGRTVASADTTRLFVSHDPVPARENLVGRLSVTVPPGRLRYRLALQEGEDNGVVLPLDTLTAPDLSGSSFALSDVVVGAREMNLQWRPTETDTVFFNPLTMFAPGGTLEVYYEVHGLPRDAAYHTELAVTKRGGSGLFGIFGKRKASISLRSDDRAEGPATRVSRRIALEKLGNGDYWVEVAITDDQGRKAVTRSGFSVRSEDKDAKH